MSEVVTEAEKDLLWAHGRVEIKERICYPRWARGEKCVHEERVPDQHSEGSK